MIKLIIEKELRDIISSKKFIITFSVCAILILMTFYVGSKNHQLNVARYEAAKAENFRKMEGLTDWLRVNSHRIFLPPQPLEALVTGVSNDIGRTINIRTGGELNANNSRFGNDPIFAIFQFLDFNFIFQIILSLFAIMFAFDDINGEKERGTLRLSFANAIPKDKYILAKLIGSFLALAIPLLIPILIGCLLLPLLGIHLTGNEWVRLVLVIISGLIYFGVFLTASIFMSVLTKKSSNSFLALLVIWILTVFIVPRSSVLLAGRAIEVPSVDQLAYQKGKYQAQLWREDINKLSKFKSTKTDDPQVMISEFESYMQELSDEREEKINKYSGRLNEERQNKQVQQEKFAFNLARISPSALFSLASTNLAGTAIDQKQHFLSEAKAYQQNFRQFIKEKTGLALGSGAMILKMGTGGEEEKPIDPNELPVFEYKAQSLAECINNSIFDMGLLVFFNILFFAGAFVGFIKYDVR